MIGMSEEMLDLYIEFLDSKGCISQETQDINKIVKGGVMTAECIMVKKASSTPELYIEFCKLHNLKVHESYISGIKVDTHE